MNRCNDFQIELPPKTKGTSPAVIAFSNPISNVATSTSPTPTYGAGTFPTHGTGISPTYAFGTFYSLVSPTLRRSLRFPKGKDNIVVDISLNSGVIPLVAENSYGSVSKANVSSQ